MHRFTVEGVDRQSGRDRSETIEASSREEAASLANQRGLMVVKIAAAERPQPAPMEEIDAAARFEHYGKISALLGLILPLMSLVGVVLCGVAMSKSDARRGFPWLVVSAITLLIGAVFQLWILLGLFGALARSMAETIQRGPQFPGAM